MSVQFHFLQSSGVLSNELCARIETVLEETVQLCSEKIKLGDVDVVIMNVAWNVIPRIGVNGFSYDAHNILLTLNHKHEYLNSHFDQTLTALLAHELHHSSRALIRGSSHSLTYGGALVAEGLACCFEEEIVGKTPFYAIECQGEALAKFSDKARKYVDSNRGELPNGWQSWMFGSYTQPQEFPYQCGYSTGYQLVRTWLDARNETASLMMGVDPDEVVDDWIKGRITPFIE